MVLMKDKPPNTSQENLLNLALKSAKLANGSFNDDTDDNDDTWSSDDENTKSEATDVDHDCDHEADINAIDKVENNEEVR